MLNLFQLLVDCSGLLGVLIGLIKHTILPIIWIGIPILLILLGSVDLAKAAISSDEKAVKQAQSAFIRRLVYGALVFFVFLIVNWIMNIVASTIASADSSTDATTWASCWNS